MYVNVCCALMIFGGVGVGSNSYLSFGRCIKLNLYKTQINYKFVSCSVSPGW